MENKVILLAEDSEDDVFLTRHAFLQAGLTYPLMAVENGVEVIKYLSGEGIYHDRGKYPIPALLLLDLKLPLKGVFEVLQWIRRHPQWRLLIVVILASLDFPWDINKAYDLSANSFLVKPGEHSKLVAMVKLLDWFWLTLNTNPSIVLPRPSVIIPPATCSEAVGLA